MTPEARIQANTLAWASQRGVQAIRLSFRIGVASGWPDAMLLIPGGKPLFIEFKRPGALPSTLQAHRIKVLRELGYACEVCDSRDSARAAITQALESAALHGARR